ncbi:MULTISPECIES: GPW/gp25 family protein [Chromobacterium]|uniref:GPW/gp25 family protein n=1 Tax=Chromobacterium TaxID=535 RepID=UPI000D3156B4|nr:MULTISPECIES: GPW/gp25 family protein [Chromobacterium]MCP1293214.1 GPW/gp25 family protein [Chromobacterium sp. S0633]PTU64952.1 type VI secretion protein [Chromobacterium sp. Panama]
MTPRLFDQLSARAGRETLAASIARDLAHLMNAALRGARLPLAAGSQLETSVWNYGRPPLAERKSSRIDPARVSAHIRDAIRRFEPRLDPERLEVSARAGSGPQARQLLYFDVAAVTRDGGEALRLSLTLDYLDGYFGLPRAAEAGAAG